MNPNNNINTYHSLSSHNNNNNQANLESGSGISGQQSQMYNNQFSNPLHQSAANNRPFNRGGEDISGIHNNMTSDSISINGGVANRTNFSSNINNNNNLNSMTKSSSGNLALVSERDMANHAAVQGIFNDTKCYDLMQASAKATVFETTIPFQLAFFALVEHDTDVAPLWDPERRQFVGLMTVEDYIQALRVWRVQRLPTTELTARSINDMMMLSNSMMATQPPQQLSVRFRHADFQGVDAEDSVVQLCLLLLRTGNDYAPVVDPDNGNLVAILGYLDILHLLEQAGNQYPQFFSQTLQELGIGDYTNILTAPKHAKICDILDALDSHHISSLPILDDNGKVIDIYFRADFSFIIKAADLDEVIFNLGSFQVDQCIALREQLLANGDVMTPFQGLVLCKKDYQLNQIVGLMMIARSTKAVVVDDSHRCVGVVSIKDIIKYYLVGGSRR